MKRVLILAALLLLPATATAADWLKRCDATEATTWLQTGDWACYQPASKNDDSVAINVAACENLDILYHLDIDADGTASSTTVNVMSCPNSTASTNSCFVLQDWTLDGDETTHTEAIYGAAALWIYLDFQNDGTINDPQVTLLCRGPAR